MTCKDCVHYEVCETHENLYLEIDITGEVEITTYLPKVEDVCDHFINKADFVEVSKAAEILNDAFGNDYSCNFNNIDEWLPYICEYANTCDCSSVKCWEQLIKHYGERRCDR